MPLGFGQSPPEALSLEFARELAGVGPDTPLVQVQGRRPRASAVVLLPGRNDESCCLSPLHTGCSAGGSSCSAASAALQHLAAAAAAGPMELADKGGGKNDESPVGAAAAAGTLGSAAAVAADIGSVAVAAEASAVEIAAAEVAAALPQSVAAGSVAFVFQFVLAGNIVAPGDDCAAPTVAFGELVAA